MYARGGAGERAGESIGQRPLNRAPSPEDGKLSPMNDAAQDLVRSLGLQPHPEGGFYRETFRSSVEVPAHGGTRRAVTSILFLLPTGARSRLHRVKSDEIWLHQRGDDVRLTVGEEEVQLGQGGAATLQAVVPPGVWQAAECLPGEAGYALVGCVVAPGFEFADFELSGD